MRSRAGSIVASCVATSFALLLTLNLTLGNKQIDEPLGQLPPPSNPQFARDVGALLGSALVGGNRVEALVNGERIFPAMLAAIEGARQSVTFETYVYWSGDIGREFADALIARAAAGVPVHVMLDWWGSDDLEEAAIERMERGGVQVRRYNPPRIPALARMNNRTHRKLLVVDGRVGFTGGVGIADAWRGDAQDPRHWRDTHFRVTGPVVAQLQSAFMDNWMAVTGQAPRGPRYFPALEPAGSQSAHIVTSSAGGGSESAQLMYLLSIAAARESIRLSMAYFVPDDVAVRSLVAARTRGVRVQIVLPGPHIDRPMLRWASRHHWGELLAAGVEIHEYQPTMYHCKVMIVDGLWTSVGSTNFDNRSFAVNDEANLNVLDAGFAAAQARLFEADLERSRPVAQAQWRSRGLGTKALDALAAAFSAQL